MSEENEAYKARIMLLNRHANLSSQVGTKHETTSTQFCIERLEREFKNEYGYDITTDPDYKKEAAKWDV